MKSRWLQLISLISGPRFCGLGNRSSRTPFYVTGPWHHFFPPSLFCRPSSRPGSSLLSSECLLTCEKHLKCSAQNHTRCSRAEGGVGEIFPFFNAVLFHHGSEVLRSWVRELPATLSHPRRSPTSCFKHESITMCIPYFTPLNIIPGIFLH